MSSNGRIVSQREAASVPGISDPHETWGFVVTEGGEGHVDSCKRHDTRLANTGFVATHKTTEYAMKWIKNTDRRT